MNINGIASSHTFQTLESSSIEQGAFTSVSGQLAVLMLDSQEQQKQIHQQEQAAARDDFEHAIADEVSALREQADAAFRGAVVQGSITIVSAGAGILNVEANNDFAAASHCHEPIADKTTYAGVISQGLGGLAQPIGTLVGTTHGAADAKSAQGRQEAAKWSLDDARDAKKDAETLQNKALDWVASMVDRDAATTSAILSNKV